MIIKTMKGLDNINYQWDSYSVKTSTQENEYPTTRILDILSVLGGGALPIKIKVKSLQHSFYRDTRARPLKHNLF